MRLQSPRLECVIISMKKPDKFCRRQGARISLLLPRHGLHTVFSKLQQVIRCSRVRRLGLGIFGPKALAVSRCGRFVQEVRAGEQALPHPVAVIGTRERRQEGDEVSMSSSVRASG
jgi:hypothetical protein